MARIVVTEFMDEKAVAVLAAHHDVVYEPGLADQPDVLAELVATADALIVRNRTQVDDSLVRSGERLRVIGRLGVGLDNIDLRACGERGIAVKPAVGANAIAVAEYVITCLLILSRPAFASSEAILDGHWPRRELTGHETQGRQLGLIGFGSIARQVARRASSLGMRVVAHDPYVAPEDWEGEVVPVDLDALLATSDAVSLHVPLVPETHHLLDAAALQRLPQHAIVINTARGGTVDEEALVEALVAGSLGGAALDVFEVEPPTPERRSLFATAPNLILTPHIAGVTVESNVRVSRVVADAVLDILGDSHE